MLKNLTSSLTSLICADEFYVHLSVSFSCIGGRLGGGKIRGRNYAEGGSQKAYESVYGGWRVIENHQYQVYVLYR